MSHEEKLLMEWEQAKERAVQANQAEKALRMEVARTLFGYDENQLQKGTQNFQLPKGWKAKMVFKLNERLEQKRVSEAKKALKASGLTCREIKKVFKEKFSVSATEYRTLSQPQKDIIDSIRSFSPGTPSLEIVSPKNGGK